VQRTIGALWRRAVDEKRSTPAYLAEVVEGWREVSWEEADRRIEDLAFGLLALGFAKGNVVGIMAPTRLEWVLADFALARIGAITAPIYATSSASDCAYMLGLVEAIGVFVDQERRPLVPALPHVLSLEELERLEERGRAYREQHPDALREAESQIGEDDLYTFIYTSGTTGAPKACMVRHRNYYSMAATVDLLEDFTLDDDLLLLYLPLAHNYGRLLVLLGAYEGYTIAFLGPLRDGRRSTQGAPVGAPERPAPVREGPHAGPGTIRRGDRSAPAPGRLGAPGRLRGDSVQAAR
jgi:long-chain acyl-CoA synthetase